jgi:tetraacyldisaccharide 4'-kinase
VNPLSAMYGAFVAIRNALYDKGVLKARKLAGPVISLGNLSVGGSGKTPFVILLGELLKQRGISFDVLSRGYGRKSRGVRLVDPNGEAAEFGDEPILIARRLGCPVVVGENRHEAGLFAERTLGPQFHILDDGFQHRKLARDFDIVLLTPEDTQDGLLPSGRLREPMSSLRRAAAVVSTGEAAVSDEHSPEILWRVKRTVSLPDPPARPFVFSGIARPQQFVEQLDSVGIQPVGGKFYRDHHLYTSSDVRELCRLRDESRAGGFITTEKDAVNLSSKLPELGEVAVARVIMQLEPADALDTMLQVIAKRRAQA